MEVIKSDQLSSFFRNPYGGEKVRELEQVFAEYHRVKHAISTSSGTTALHTALLACGIGSGMEVITTPYTFIASSSTILMTGAVPRFADVDELTYNIDPAEILKLVTPHTKAILPVHLLGQPCNMEAITDIANHFKLWVIEDACQALGAKIKRRLVGTIGHLGVFSAQETKTVTFGGEGGMIVTNDDELAERCRQIRNHAEKYFDAPYLGFNYRLTEMQAAFGLAQMKKLDRFNEIQIRNAKYICDRLPKGITPPYQDPYTKHVYFLIGAQYDAEQVGTSRQEFLRRLKERGLVQMKPGMNVSGGYSKLVYEHPLFQLYKRSCPVAERLIQTSLWVDLHRWKTLEQVKQYVQVFKEVIK